MKPFINLYCPGRCWNYKIINFSFRKVTSSKRAGKEAKGATESNSNEIDKGFD